MLLHILQDKGILRIFSGLKEIATGKNVLGVVQKSVPIL